MTTFKLTQSLITDPFRVEYAAQTDGEEVVGLIELKHPGDWTEAGLDEYVRIAQKFQQIKSLNSKKKKPTATDVADSTRVMSAFTKILRTYGIHRKEQTVVWDSISLKDKSTILEAFLEWSKEVSEGE